MTTCDKCSKDFRIQLKVKKLKNGVDETYFTCFHCAKRYVVSCMDRECKKLQSQIQTMQELKNKAGNNLSKEKITEEEYIKRINNIERNKKRKQKELNFKSNLLKERYSS